MKSAAKCQVAPKLVFVRFFIATVFLLFFIVFLLKGARELIWLGDKKSVSLKKSRKIVKMLSSFSKSFRNSFRKIRKNDDERRDDKRTQSMNIHRSYSTDAHIYSNSFMHCQESQNNSIIPERYLIGIVNFHSTFFYPNLSLKPGASLEKNIFSSMR